MYVRTPSGIVVAKLAEHSKLSRRARWAREARAYGRAVALLAVITATVVLLIVVGLKNAGLI